jgi:putative membrane protein
MTLVVWTFALLAALLHIVVFVWEAVLFRRPGVHQKIFFVPTADVPAVRLWAFGVGFYNLFLACGLVAGVVAWGAGHEAAGRALVIYICLFMFLSGLVLLVADRLALSRPRGKGLGGAAAQSLPPLIALIAAAL